MENPVPDQNLARFFLFPRNGRRELVRLRCSVGDSLQNSQCCIHSFAQEELLPSKRATRRLAKGERFLR